MIAQMSIEKQAETGEAARETFKQLLNGSPWGHFDETNKRAALPTLLMASRFGALHPEWEVTYMWATRNITFVVGSGKTGFVGTATVTAVDHLGNKVTRQHKLSEASYQRLRVLWGIVPMNDREIVGGSTAFYNFVY